MTLSTRIYTRGTRLDYEYRPKDGTHSLWVARPGESVQSTIAGHIINALVPYREGSSEVRELISWLSGFGPNGGWCKPRAL